MERHRHAGDDNGGVLTEWRLAQSTHVGLANFAAAGWQSYGPLAANLRAGRIAPPVLSSLRLAVLVFNVEPEALLSAKLLRDLLQDSIETAGKAGRMPGRPFGIILLAATLLAAGLAGIAAFWVAWPRTSNTSPLAALLALVWSCTYLVTALLTWRRSRFAGPAFLAAMGLLLPLFSFIFPGGHGLLLTPFVITCVFALLGYRYLQGPRQPAA